MNQTKNLIKTLSISFLFLLVFSVALSASAWVGPSKKPPKENTEPPINISTYSQDKKGDLKIKGTLTADYEFCLGKVCKTSWPSGGDGYIGDWESKKHTAGSNLDMNDLSIENVKILTVGTIYNEEGFTKGGDFSINTLGIKIIGPEKDTAGENLSNSLLYLQDSGATHSRWGFRIANKGDLHLDGYTWTDKDQTRVIFDEGGDVKILLGDLSMNSNNIKNVKTISAKKFLYTSDRRLKNNIETLDNSLDKITKLRGVNFQWKKDYTKEKQVGLVAQEVEKVYPELVSADSEGMKSVQYGNLIAPLVESVKKLNSKTKEQQKEIEKQNGRIKELEEKIEKILNK